MNLLLTKMDPPSISALDDTDRPQLDWPRSRGQDSLDKATSAQLQKLPFASHSAVVMMGITDALVAGDHKTISQLYLAEPPKGQEWSKPHAVTMQDSKVSVSVVGTVAEAMIGSVWRRNYGTDSPKVAKPVSDQEVLADVLRELLRSANYEVFEDGMDGDFSNSLNRIIRDRGVAAVYALEGTIYADGVNPEVAAEALIWVGRMDDKASQNARLSMLERALESPNVCIRDAASIGIGAMDDPAAIGSLRKAIDRERCGLLRQNLKDTLEQLKDVR